MVDRTQVNLLLASQNAAVGYCQQLLGDLWTQLQGQAPQTQRDLLLDAVPGIVDQFSNVAATAAAEWYEQVRDDDIGSTGYHATVGSGFPSEAVQDSIRWKAGVLWDDPEQMARFLRNASDRWVKYGGRATLYENMYRDQRCTSWALVPAGKCCAWCTMLASRGFDYVTRDTACKSMHNNCDCMPTPSFDSKKAFISGYDPDAMYEQYEKAYDTLHSNDQPAWLQDLKGDDQSKILEIMRREFPDEYTDGEHGWVNNKQKRQKNTVGNLNLANWNDYRASLAERFMAANNPEWKMPPEQPVKVPSSWRQSLGRLSEKHLNHILYGNMDYQDDEYVYEGGHLYGYGWIGNRDEFSSGMTVDDVLDLLERTLDGNTGITFNVNGEDDGITRYYKTIDGRKYVALSTPKQGIISFYPIHVSK